MSPPPVSRKGASKLVKTATRRRGARRDSPSAVLSSPFDSSPSPKGPASRRSRRPSQTTRIARVRPSYKYSPDKAASSSHLIHLGAEAIQEKGASVPVRNRVARGEEIVGGLLVLSLGPVVVAAATVKI
ncbi:unnamed protein product [Urochloa humidicola]